MLFDVLSNGSTFWVTRYKVNLQYNPFFLNFKETAGNSSFLLTSSFSSISAHFLENNLISCFKEGNKCEEGGPLTSSKPKASTTGQGIERPFHYI